MGEAELCLGLRGRKGAGYDLRSAAARVGCVEEPRQELPSSVLLWLQAHPDSPSDHGNAPNKTMKVAKLQKIIMLINLFMVLVQFTPHCVRLY